MSALALAALLAALPAADRVGPFAPSGVEGQLAGSRLGQPAPTGLASAEPGPPAGGEAPGAVPTAAGAPAPPATSAPASPTAATLAPESSPPASGAPTAAPQPRGPVVYQPPVFEHRNTWDVGLEGGVGTMLPPWHVLGLARLRLGALWIRNSFYWSLGLTAEWTNAHPVTFGIQGELMHLESGLWVQVTPLMIDTTPRPGAMVAVGYSVVGVEAQLRDFNLGGTEAVRFAVFVKLRIPVRLFLKALGI